MRPAAKNRSRLVIGLSGGAALVLAACALVLFGKDTQAAEAPPSQAVVARPIPTAVVQAAPAGYERVFPGNVRANRRVELAFSVPGLLDRLNAEEGRRIRQGEVIAGLDERDYRYALDAAAARCANAKRELARHRNLRRQGVVTESEYEDAQTAHDIAVAELRTCEKALEDTVLRAPFDGVVVERYAENHEHVQAKRAIVAFQDISLVEVVVPVPERLFARGGAGALRSPRVRFDADGERWFDATVREHSARSDRVTQTYDLVVALAPPPDLNVLPGMTATVKVRIAGSSDAASPTGHATQVPAEALWLGRDGGSYVWVIDPAGADPSKRRVETVNMRDGCVEVRSGLRPGEHVAIAGLHTLREGLRVRPMVAGKEGLDG